MSGVKRAFPFSDEDVPHTTSSDFMSVKRSCLHSKCFTGFETGNFQSVGAVTNSCEQTEMDHDSYPENFCKSGTQTYPELQNGDVSHGAVTNNNSTSTVCVRCQAGEPGHIGHIGR